MEEIVFSGHGIHIIHRGDDHFISYDAGALVPRFEEVKVTPEQAERAKLSENDAYKVLLEATAGR